MTLISGGYLRVEVTVVNNGNVTLTQVVWQQQQLGMWFALPLSLAFILFIVAAGRLKLLAVAV